MDRKALSRWMAECQLPDEWIVSIEGVVLSGTYKLKELELLDRCVKSPSVFVGLAAEDAETRSWFSLDAVKAKPSEAPVSLSQVRLEHQQEVSQLKTELVSQGTELRILRAEFKVVSRRMDELSQAFAAFAASRVSAPPPQVMPAPAVAPVLAASFGHDAGSSVERSVRAQRQASQVKPIFPGSKEGTREVSSTVAPLSRLLAGSSDASSSRPVQMPSSSAGRSIDDVISQLRLEAAALQKLPGRVVPRKSSTRSPKASVEGLGIPASEPASVSEHLQGPRLGTPLSLETKSYARPPFPVSRKPMPPSTPASFPAPAEHGQAQPPMQLSA